VLNHNTATTAPPSIPKKFPIVTFREFAALAGRRHWTAEQLAARFRGRIDEPTEFFKRVLTGKSPERIIPYRSVIKFYSNAQKQPDPRVTPNQSAKVRHFAVNDFLEHV